MSFLHDVLALLHLVGFAALFCGFFTQLRAAQPVITMAMLHGALTQLVTGRCWSASLRVSWTTTSPST
jgi:hypothetical protein